jgi:hypothetical protein
LCSSGKTSSKSGQAEHSPEKRAIEPRTSNAVPLTMLGQGCPRPPAGSARIWLQRQYYSEQCRSHPPPRARRIQGELKNLLEDAAVRRAESSASRRQGCPPGASRNDFPTHAGGLGPHRAHAGRDACSPGSPRRRATPSQPSSPPRREGAARLPPQAWMKLRQRGGSESLARTTRSTSLQPGHTTSAVPGSVPGPDYHHQVLGGDKAGVVACGLPAGMPAGRDGR